MVWNKIGNYARLIHNIPVSGLGLDSEDLTGATFNSSRNKWNRYVTYNIESLTSEDRLLKLGVLNSTQSKKIIKLLENLIQKQFTFGLNHGDLSLRNIIVSPMKIVSIFDWGSAEAQIVPHHDIGEILKSSLKSDSPEFRSFLNGYGLSESGYRQIEDDVHSLMLLRAIDKLRCAIDKHPKDVPSFTRRVKEMFQLKFK